MEDGFLSGLIFDLDGTLIDSALDLHAACAKLLSEENHPPLSVETIRSFVGNGVPKLVERAMHAVGIMPDPAQLEALSARFLVHYEAAPSDLTRPYPGVAEALSALQASGYKMAVCTNKPQTVSRMILQDLGLAEYFNAIVGGDTCGVKKPDPKPVHHAMELLECNHALYIGDSETDAETAKRAKLPFMLFTEGYRKTPIEQIEHQYAFTEFALLPSLVVSALSLSP